MTNDPLVELWRGWWNKAKLIKSEKGVNEAELKAFSEQFSPRQMPSPSTPVKELTEDEFWEDLTQALRDLTDSSKEQAVVDEIRVGDAVSRRRYSEVDRALVEALSSGKVQSYRRVHVVVAGEELDALEALVKGSQIEVGYREGQGKRDPNQALSIFVSLSQSGRQPVEPWSFWVIRPENVLYLRHHTDTRPWTSSGCLVIREATLVNAFLTYFDVWWANKSQMPSNTCGLFCDCGRVDQKSLGMWRRELGE